LVTRPVGRVRRGDVAELQGFRLRLWKACSTSVPVPGTGRVCCGHGR